MVFLLKLSVDQVEVILKACAWSSVCTASSRIPSPDCNKRTNSKNDPAAIQQISVHCETECSKWSMTLESGAWRGIWRALAWNLLLPSPKARGLCETFFLAPQALSTRPKGAGKPLHIPCARKARSSSSNSQRGTLRLAQNAPRAWQELRTHQSPLLAVINEEEGPESCCGFCGAQLRSLNCVSCKNHVTVNQKPSETHCFAKT